MVFILWLNKVIRKAVLLNSNPALVLLSSQMTHSEFGNQITFDDLLLATLVFISGITIPISSLGRQEIKTWKNRMIPLFRRVFLFSLLFFIYNSYLNKTLGSNEIVFWGGACYICRCMGRSKPSLLPVAGQI